MEDADSSGRAPEQGEPVLETTALGTADPVVAGPEETGGAVGAAHASPRRSRAWAASRIATASALVGLIGVAAVYLATRSGEGTAAGPGTPPGPVSVTTLAPTESPSPVPPPRPVFAFGEVSISGVAVVRGGHAREVVQPVGDEIAAALSSFYDRAFLDPATWAGGLPDDIWRLFDPTLTKRAKRDAATFSLGDAGPQVVELELSRAELTVRVLLDDHDRPQAALADVVLDATGSLRDGHGLEVTHRTTYLFRPIDGSWLVVGYPEASTKVEDVPPPSPSPSPTPTSSTRPSSTGSSPGSPSP